MRRSPSMRRLDLRAAKLVPSRTSMPVSNWYPSCLRQHVCDSEERDDLVFSSPLSDVTITLSQIANGSQRLRAFAAAVATWPRRPDIGAPPRGWIALAIKIT